MRTIRFKPLTAKLLLGIPVIAFCVDLKASDFWVFAIWAVFWVWLSHEDKQWTKEFPYATLPSTQMVRSWIWFTIFFFPFLFTITEGYPNWSQVLWYGLGLSLLSMASVFKMWSLDPATNYGRVWNTLPWPWNPDSSLTRRGGFAEPQYTDFVPPEDWIYQCPQCGARVPAQRGVCWRSNYGADGDSTAYYWSFAKSR